MSTGRSAAKRAEAAANEAASQDRTLRVAAEQRLARERERAQHLFIRQLRARMGGGFFRNPGPEQTGNTLG